MGGHEVYTKNNSMGRFDGLLYVTLQVVFVVFWINGTIWFMSFPLLSGKNVHIKAAQFKYLEHHMDSFKADGAVLSHAQAVSRFLSFPVGCESSGEQQSGTSVNLWCMQTRKVLKI